MVFRFKTGCSVIVECWGRGLPVGGSRGRSEWHRRTEGQVATATPRQHARHRGLQQRQ